MKPVAIFRHYPTEGPGYFATFLDNRGIAWRIIKIDAGEAVPENARQFSGLAFMGGPMSVNDELPWIAPVLQLIREAAAMDMPLVGHCLGGQLMAKALGGAVGKNRVKEIGWGEVSVADHPVARAWLGEDLKSFDSFHWHGETFTIPEGSTRILSNLWCENQAFALGKHLALQCHVEMTGDLIRTWCDSGAREIARNLGPSVQTAQAMQENLPERISRLNAIAERMYSRWIAGLAA